MRNRLINLIITCLAIFVTVKTQGQSYNYAEVLQKSMFFYECQESGELWPDNRVSWRANSALNDGADVGLDLTGGWYDAGDHVKFNFPMAFSATALAWGAIDFADGYTSTGQMQYLKRNLRWVNDYFIKCHTASNELWGQVGNGGIDHGWWGSAEVMRMDRPAYKIDASNPGSDLAAETAAAMAAASILFQNDDPSYSATLLQHAEQLYSFADNYRGVYSDAITDAAGYYRSYSGYNDELVWGAIWLYRATGDQSYLDKAEEYYANLSTEPQTDIKSYKWGIAWDDKSYGCYALLAKLTGKAEYVEAIERHLDYWTDGYNGERITYTPGGLAYLDVWGALRYANNTGFLALYYYDIASTSAKVQKYFDFAKAQADYALGSNPRNSSYVVGFGNNPTSNPHHRTAHGAWANNQNGPPEFTRHTLYGAMAGGPNSDDSYEDVRSNYINNEVACDYNACFSGVMAGLVEEFGGSPLSNFPVIETPTDEYYTGAITNSAQDRFFEWSVQTFNHTAWPAREGNEYKFRLFVDISEGLAAGLSLSDYTVTTNNSGVVSITQLQPWDEANNIYYTEVTYLPGIEIWPGGDQYDSQEAQVRIGIPNDGPVEGWDVTNDPSYDPAMNSGDRSNPPQSTGIPLYVDGVLVFGNEPDGGNSIPVESVSVSPTSSTLDIGETVQLTATVLPTDATNKSVTWSSSNTSVATVSTSGYVTAVSPGSATITVKTASGGYTATSEITVNEPPYIDVTNVSLNVTSQAIDINESFTLIATITPSDATDKSITWSTSNASIASVNSNGIVTGVGEGQAIITAQTSNPDVSATCVVDVSDAVILPQYSLEVTTVGSGSVTLSPAGGIYDEGTQVILTATADNGYHFSSWSGDADGTDSVITITMNSDKSVTATFLEDSGCGTEIAISMPFSQDGAGENCYVAEGTLNYVNSWNMDLVEVNGLDVTNAWANNIPASSDGKIHIHLVASVPWAHFEIDGVDGSTQVIPVTSVSVSPESATVEAGETTNLSVTVSPGNATDQSVTWSTSNSSVATVNSSGVVTGIAEGDAIITVTTNDGGFTASATISVTETPVIIPVTDVILEPSSAIIEIGETVTLTPTVLPGDATDQSILWSSNDNSVAIVNSNGVVTGVAEGVVLITATTNDGGFTASSEITVIDGGAVQVCENPVSITLSFSQNGSGEYCWFTTDDIAYVNSWAANSVVINGTDFTNTWSNSMPAKIDGGYYISYSADYSWSHIEVAALKSAGTVTVNTVRLYPNPFNESINIEISNPETVYSMIVMDQLGRIVLKYNNNEITDFINIGQELPSGIYFLNVNRLDGSENYIINKN